jgi:hypothetical protein
VKPLRLPITNKVKVRKAMNMFFTRRGKLENWYKQKTKELNDSYFAFVDGGVINAGGETSAQRANSRSRELEEAKAALKQEYLERLKAMGHKPRADF